LNRLFFWCSGRPETIGKESRRAKHVEFERKRREDLRLCFEELASAVPNAKGIIDQSSNKAYKWYAGFPPQSTQTQNPKTQEITSCSTFHLMPRSLSFFFPQEECLVAQPFS